MVLIIKESNRLPKLQPVRIVGGHQTALISGHLRATTYLTFDVPLHRVPCMKSQLPTVLLIQDAPRPFF